MSRILLTGGAGFIGSALSRRLAQSHDVVVLDDMSTGKPENLDGIGVELVQGSILDRGVVDELMSEADLVFHLACKGVRHSIHQPVANHEVNATGTLMLLESARLFGIQRFVYTSTSEVYGTATIVPMPEHHPTHPHTVYGGSKLAGELYTQAYHTTYGLETIVIRPFNSFGPRSHHEGDSGEVIPRFVVRAMNGLPPVIFGDGSQTRDFTYVDDTAAGIAAAATADGLVGKTVNLGSGEEVRIDKLASVILEITGYGELEPIFDEPRPGDVNRLVSDSATAATTLGWAPQVTLEEGIEHLLDWHRAQGTDWAAALAEEKVRNWRSDT